MIFLSLQFGFSLNWPVFSINFQVENFTKEQIEGKHAIEKRDQWMNEGMDELMKA